MRLELEKVIHDAKAASLEIEGLIPHLEKPPILS